MTHVGFPDLDTAIEYALGFVIKEEAEKVQATFKEAWGNTFERLAAQKVSVSLYGVISYGEEGN